VKVIIKRVDSLEKVKQLRIRDNKVVKVVEEMKQKGVKMLRDEK